MDGAVIVHYLPPDKGKTFADYVRGTFFPHICRALDHHLRVDIVFDVYKEDSLKEGTRKTRGKGVGIKVFINTTLPKTTITRGTHILSFVRLELCVMCNLEYALYSQITERQGNLCISRVIWIE